MSTVAVEIDQQVMVDAVKQVVQKGLTEGVGSWETQRLITDAVKEAIDTAKLPGMIEEALTGRLEAESEEIVAAIMDEALPMVREAFKQSFRAALRSMVYGLMLGPPDSGYQTDEAKRAWNQTQAILGETEVPA